MLALHRNKFDREDRYFKGLWYKVARLTKLLGATWEKERIPQD